MVSSTSLYGFIRGAEHKVLPRSDEVLALVAVAMALSGEVCVVTGACGFLGEKLIRLLLEEEKLAEIRLLDRHIRSELIQSFDGKWIHTLQYVSSKITNLSCISPFCVICWSLFIFFGFVS